MVTAVQLVSRSTIFYTVAAVSKKRTDHLQRENSVGISVCKEVRHAKAK